MNVLQFSEEGVQVWNNAAFDGEDFTVKTSWSSSECTKENVSPTSLNTTSQPKFKNNDNKLSSFDEKKIDDEIAQIENDIKRLTSRLASLRLQKADRKITSDKRVSGAGGGGGGRVIAAKFMEPKRNVVVLKEETPKNSKARVCFRRGMSLGPAEISGRIPPATAPIPPGNRRKSCFWKPPEIIEEERSKTLGSRKSVKKKEETIQPRNLFKESEIEKSQSNKKILKPGRVVASRYNQSIGNRNSCGVEAKKRLLPENNNNRGSEVKVKKRWEIPEEVDVHGVLLLPKIKTLRRSNNNESPRDSGAAKRVAELTGKRSYFCNEDEKGLEKEESVCQVLDFAQESDDECRMVMN